MCLVGVLKEKLVWSPSQERSPLRDLLTLCDGVNL